jgi:hypothetical protein
VSKYLLALEARGHALAAEVENEAEVDGDVEVEAQHVGLDGGAEAHGGVQLDEPVQQRAARLVLGHAGLGLDQVKHVGAHAQLQRVRRAVPAVPPGRTVIGTAAASSVAVAAVVASAVPAAVIPSPAAATRCAAAVVAATGRTASVVASAAVATVVVARAAVRAGTGHRNEQEVDGKEEGRLGRHWSRLTRKHPAATARQLQVCVSQWWRSSLHRLAL